MQVENINLIGGIIFVVVIVSTADGYTSKPSVGESKLKIEIVSLYIAGVASRRVDASRQGKNISRISDYQAFLCVVVYIAKIESTVGRINFVVIVGVGIIGTGGGVKTSWILTLKT